MSLGGIRSTMWMFVLVMMVHTRTRSEENSQGLGNQVVAEGSTSAIMSRTNRRRKRNTLNTEATEQSTTTITTEQDDAAEQPLNPPKRRGPNVNHSLTKILRNLPKGSKVPLIMDEGTKTFVGISGKQFSTECGIIVRNNCPMKFHTWDSVPETDKAVVCEKLEGKFQLLRTDKVFMEYVDSHLHRQWKRTRGLLSRHWKKNEGKNNPQLARSKMSPDCRNEEDWNNLCDYWELEKTRKYSDQMEVNRGKQVHVSRGGSRSIANLVFQMTNPETKTPPSPFEVYCKMHIDVGTKELTEHANTLYDDMVKHKKAAMAKLNSEGTTITIAMEHKLEKEAIKSFCGKEKTIQSAWEVGVGPVLRKKDNWVKVAAESSQQDSNETEKLRNKVVELEEQLKEDKERSKKMEEFISSKFPDFESTIFTPVSNETSGLDGTLSDSEDMI